jgi:hypothetical protein
MFLQNFGWLSIDYTALSQKTELFITTAVRSSNPRESTWQQRVISQKK